MHQTSESELIVGYLQSHEDHALNKATLDSQRDIKHYGSLDQQRDCCIIPAEPDGNCGFTSSNRVLMLFDLPDIAHKISRTQFIELVEIEFKKNDPSTMPLILAIFKNDHTEKPTPRESLDQWSRVFIRSGYWMYEAHFALLSKIYNFEFRFYCLDSERNIFIPEIGNESIYFGNDKEKSITINLAHMALTSRDGTETLNHYDGLILEPTPEQRQRIGLMKGKYHDKEKIHDVHTNVKTEKMLAVVRELASEERQSELLALAEQGQQALVQGSVEQAREIYVKLLGLSHEIDHHHYESQVLGYEGLGKVYETNKKWIDAIALYHFALGVLDNPEKTQTFPDKITRYRERLIRAIENSEAAFLEHVTGKKISAKSCENYQKHQRTLKNIADTASDSLKRNQEIREKILTELSSQEDRISYLRREQRCLEEAGVSIAQIHRQISEQLRQLVKVLITETMEQLSEWRLPLSEEEYVFICFGSLARDEATPYSDLEFAVLLADGKNTEENKNYFRVLTKLLNIKVINLHETTPRMQYIEELVEIGLVERYSESPVKAGFCFDGNNADGRKTPLGNMEYQDVSEEKRYELIKTPAQLAEYQSEAWFEKDSHMSTVLMTASLIIGNQELLVQYQGLIDIILNAEFFEKQNSSIVIQDDVKVNNESEREKTTVRQYRAIKHLRESIEEFQFRGGRFEEKEHFFDAKYHLYRLPNMLVDHLSLYFKGQAKSLWARLNELFGEYGLIGSNNPGWVNSTEAVSGILAIRLQAYLRKHERNNQIIALDNFGKKDDKDNSEWVAQHLGIQEKLLINIYRVVIPFQTAAKDFLANHKTNELIESAYYDGSAFLEGQYYQLLMQYEKAVNAYERDKTRMAQIHGSEDISLVPICNNLGVVLSNQRQYVKALSEYEQAKTIALHVHGSEHISVGETWHNIGIVYEAQGRYEEALAAYEQAKSIKIRLQSPEHISVGETWNNIGIVYEAQGRYEKSLEAYEQAKSITLRVHDPKHISVSVIWNNIGNVCEDQGRYEYALVALECAKSIKIRVHGPMHISVGEIWINIGNVYKAQGRYEEAFAALERAKSIMIRVHGPEHISVGDTWNNIGNVYEAQGRYEEALVALERAKSIKIRAHGSRHISVGDTWNNIGIVYRAQGRYEEALAAYEQAKTITLRVHGSDHISMSDTWNNIGIVYEAQGRYEEALAAYEQAKTITLRVHGPEHISASGTWNNIGGVYQAQGRYEESLSAFERAKSIRICVHGPEHISVALIWYNIGGIAVELKNFETAQDAYRRAAMIYQHQKHRFEPGVQKAIKFSYVRQGNQLLLEGSQTEAKACYQKSEFPLNFLLPDTHQSFANYCYNNNQVLATIEHYRIIILLDSQDADAYHNLACMYNCQAQLKKMIHHYDEYLTALQHAENFFQKAIELDRNTSVLTEYAQFMLINIEKYSLDNVISLLNEVIVLNQRNEDLVYSKIERYTVDSFLQKLIDKYGNISFNTYLFAHYLLVKCYLFSQQQEDAKKWLDGFEKLVANAAKENEEGIRQLELMLQKLPAEVAEQELEIAEIIKAKRIEKNCCEELLKQTQYLIDTSVKAGNIKIEEEKNAAQLLEQREIFLQNKESENTQETSGDTRKEIDRLLNDNQTEAEKKNIALLHFLGSILANKKDLSHFDQDYDLITIAHLTHLQEPAQCLRYVFKTGTTPHFVEQLRYLNILANQFRCPALFISPAPAEMDSSHFIMGVLWDNQLLFINPLGKRLNRDLVSCLSAISNTRSETHIVRKLYLSNDVIQKDPEGQSSCGPICVELLKAFNQHIDQITSQFQMWNQIPQEKGQLDQDLFYYSVSLGNEYIPARLQAMTIETAQSVMEQVRQDHREDLEVLPLMHLDKLSDRDEVPSIAEQNRFIEESIMNAPEQILIWKLSMEQLRLDHVEHEPAYQALKRRFVTSLHQSSEEIDKSTKQLISSSDSEFIRRSALQQTLESELNSGYLQSQEDYALNKATLDSQRDVKHYLDQENACCVIPSEPDGNCGFTSLNRVLMLLDLPDIAHKITRTEFIELVKREFEKDDPSTMPLILAIFKNDRTEKPTPQESLNQWTTVFTRSGYWLYEPHFALLSKIYNLEFRFYCLDSERNIFIPEIGNESIYHGDDKEKSITINLAHIALTSRDGTETLNHYDGLILEPTPEQLQRIELMKGKYRDEEKIHDVHTLKPEKALPVVRELVSEERESELLALADQGQKALEQGKVEQVKEFYVKLLGLSHEINQYHYESQILGYEGLGRVYENNQKWIDAVALYHFALGVLDDSDKTKTFADKVAFYRVRLIKAIESNEATFLEHVTGKKISPRSYESYQKHQETLKNVAESAIDLLKRNEEIRKRLQAESNEQEDRLSYLQREQSCLEDAGVSIEQIHQQISEKLRQLVKMLITETMDQLIEWRPQLSEEDYAIICFGSLARDEATPYSDLEFAVLLADGKDTEENKNYFRVVTKLLNIKVINLHKTTPRMQYIEELVKIGLAGQYSESPIRAGFCFDGNNAEGRKTPLGNWGYADVPEDKHYELIKTVEQLADYQSEEWFKKDLHLSTVLMTATLMMGSNVLLVNYQLAVDKILDTGITDNRVNQGVKNCKQKENYALNDEVSEKRVLRLRQHRALMYLRESLEAFQFRGGRFGEEGHFFDAKYHLYRLPNILIDHLAMYFSVGKKSLWGRIKELLGENGLIGKHEEGVVNLTTAASTVLALRLRAYLRKRGRDNQLINLNEANKNDNAAWVSQHLGVEESKLIDIYRILYPLQLQVEEFIDNQEVKVLLDTNYYYVSPFIEGWFYNLLLQYEKALSAYGRDKAITTRVHGPEHGSLAATWNNIGAVYEVQGRYTEALSAFEQTKMIRIRRYGPKHLTLAGTWHNIGSIYAAQCQCSEALLAYEEAKAISIRVHGPEHIFLADIWNNIGNVYRTQGHYTEAHSAYGRAKAISTHVHGPKHISLAAAWNNIGVVYEAQGQYTEALSAHERAKAIRICLHGPEHISLAATWNDIGNVYEKEGQYIEALLAHERAKEIITRVHGPEHISLGGTWNNIGNVYIEQGLYTEALIAYERAKAISIRVHGPEHISLAAIWNNIGNVYNAQSQYLEALSAYERTKAIITRMYFPEHISLAETWNNIGVVYEGQGQYTEALSAHERAKEIITRVHGPEHISLGGIWDNSGNVYAKQGQYMEALIAYERAKAIKTCVHGPENISLAATWNNIGNVCADLCQYGVAFSAYEQAKLISTRVHGPKHSSLASIWKNIGKVHCVQGQYTEALSAYEEAKAIIRHVHGPEHSSLAAIWHNIGDIYYAQRHYTEALLAYEQIKVIITHEHGREHSSLAATWNNIGVVYEVQAQYTAALAAYEQAKAISTRVHGPQHISLAETWNNIGNVYTAYGQYREALSVYEHANAIMSHVHGEKHLSVAVNWFNIGNTYVELMEFKQARDAYQKALIIFQDQQHPYQHKAQKLLGISYIREGSQFLLNGESSEAKRCYEKAGLREFLRSDIHCYFANIFYEGKNLPGSIEHYYLAILLNPQLAFAYHNLGCLYHCQAQLKNMIHKHDEYLRVMHQAEDCFNEAIKLDEAAGVLTEYAQFMLTNLEQFCLDDVIARLNQATTHNQKNDGLSYGFMERYTVDSFLQKLIDKYHHITLNAYLLAYYLLVKSYLFNHQPEMAKKTIEEFEQALARVTNENDGKIEQLEGQQQQLSEDLIEEKVNITEEIATFRTEKKCHESLFKQTQHLINTPISEWGKEEKCIGELQESLPPFILQQSSGRQGFFAGKTKNTQLKDELVLDEFQNLVKRGKVIEESDTQVLIAFNSFEDAEHCQEILYKLGISDTEFPDQIREIEVIEENDSNKCEFAIRLSSEEYQNITGSILKPEFF